MSHHGGVQDIRSALGSKIKKIGLERERERVTPLKPAIAYRWSSLRFDHRLLSCNPSGCSG